MSAIIEFFVSLLDIIASLVQLLVTMVESVIWVVTNLPQMIAGVTSGFAYAPSFIYPFLSFSVGILIVFMILRVL